MVRENLQALFALQSVDSRVLEVERWAAQLPLKIKQLEGELEVLRGALGQVNSDVESKRLAQREIEGQISEESAKHKKWRKRLNEIKTPREYQALSREIEMGDRQVKSFEESVLGIMSEVEEKQKVIASQDSVLKERELEVAGQVREIRARQAEFAREAAQIASGRIEIIATLPPPMLKKYEQVRERRNGVAVVLVTEGCCQGCNVQLRPQLVLEIRRYTTMTTCPNCQRILVPDELVPTAASKDAED